MTGSFTSAMGIWTVRAELCGMSAYLRGLTINLPGLWLILPSEGERTTSKSINHRDANALVVTIQLHEVELPRGVVLGPLDLVRRHAFRVDRQELDPGHANHHVVMEEGESRAVVGDLARRCPYTFPSSRTALVVVIALPPSL
ncbi:hypothetical protein GGS23DRAFT_590130 [Durotheca rogersii]|uniref:uncharacterized protein n=1 Tax=Durotheca rogersii TaxID=419775 RepID=UPI00221F2B1E|nr:uncharacterized protein GGS23DRAFT_590130 [Durotheca rogersii]KAI5855086.1 hypothetical protein GGS23DRAFT_590130 [Durotheca rogersii]